MRRWRSPKRRSLRAYWLPAPRKQREFAGASRISFLSRPRTRSLARQQVTIGIGEDHVAHGLVIFDVPGATAEVAVERLGNRSLKLLARHRRLRQALK